MQTHTVYDDYVNNVLADLSHIDTVKCQVRNKVATRNSKGIFEHPIVTDVTAVIVNSILTLSLTRTQTSALLPGQYIIDVVATSYAGVDESLLDPEPIKVVNHPTIP